MSAHTWKSMIALMALVFLLSACGGGAKSDAAAQTVENYLTALVAQDADQLSTSSCQAWEENALLDMDAFIGVTASLDQMACKVSGTDGDTTLVTCEGKILATYNNEQQELDLAGQTYQVVQEGGEWRVCGYR